MEQRADIQRQALRRSVSNLTLYLDFDTVAVLNVWIRHQKTELGLKRVLIVTLMQVIMYLLECACLIGTVILPIFQPDEESNVGKIVVTVITWIVCSLLTIWLKISFQRNISKPDVYCTNQVGGFWNAVLLIMKPCKYFRTFYHRSKKMTVLGKDFIHGETVSSEQFAFILKINREELIDARDDVHDAFLSRLPMALLQFYLFSHSPDPLQICSLIDCFRLVVVALNLFVVIQSSLMYERKKEIYLDSLHVQGHLHMNGRYDIPLWSKDSVTEFLHGLCVSTSILSRFFVISYMASAGYGYGIACTFIIYMGNWIIVFLFPNVLSTVENLPLGITIRPHNLVRRWINTFSGFGTRFYELTKFPVKLCGKTTRVPLVITQMITFLISVVFVYCFGEFVHISGRNNSTSTKNELVLLDSDKNDTLEMNSTRCENLEEWSEHAQLASGLITSILDFLNIVCYNPKRPFYNGLHFHWIMFYFNVIITFAYNWYFNVYLRARSTNDFFPPMVSLLVFKEIFKKLFELKNTTTQVNLLSRFLFLTGIDLEHFNSLYLTYCRGDGEGTEVVSSVKWWEPKILRVVEAFDTSRGRYRDNSSSVPNLTSLPVETEIHTAYATIERLPYSYRLYLLCGTKIDSSLTTQITSSRLEATIDMLQLSKDELCTAMENIISHDQ